MEIESATVTVEELAEEFRISIIVSEEESGIVIGRRAETLEAIQHIVRVIFQANTSLLIVVNVNDFRQRREEYLKDLAQNVAQKVMDSGETYTLRLSPSERRLVHMALSQHESVMTESEGEGDYRVLKVMIKQN